MYDDLGGSAIARYHLPDYLGEEGAKLSVLVPPHRHDSSHAQISQEV